MIDREHSFGSLYSLRIKAAKTWSSIPAAFSRCHMLLSISYYEKSVPPLVYHTWGFANGIRRTVHLCSLTKFLLSFARQMLTKAATDCVLS